MLNLYLDMPIYKGQISIEMAYENVENAQGPCGIIHNVMIPLDLNTHNLLVKNEFMAQTRILNKQ